MTSPAVQSVGRLGLNMLLVMSVAAPALAQTTAAARAEKPAPRWSVLYPLFVWLPIFGIDATLPAAPPCDGCAPEIPSGSGTSTGLSGAVFAGGRFEGRRFELLANYNYAGLTAERANPLFHAEVQISTAAVIGGIRVYGPFFVEGGARYHAMDASITIGSFTRVDWRPNVWSPSIGASWRQALNDRWRVFSHIDWSGIGTGDTSIVSAEARIEWRPWAHFALTGGYGFGRVRIDREIQSNPIRTRQTLHGPILGIGIPF